MPSLAFASSAAELASGSSELAHKAGWGQVRNVAAKSLRVPVIPRQILIVASVDVHNIGQELGCPRCATFSCEI